MTLEHLAQLIHLMTMIYGPQSQKCKLLLHTVSDGLVLPLMCSDGKHWDYIRYDFSVTR